MTNTNDIADRIAEKIAGAHLLNYEPLGGGPTPQSLKHERYAELIAIIRAELETCEELERELKEWRESETPVESEGEGVK